MSEYPYGKGYQKVAAKLAVKAGCRGNTMGVFFYLCAQKFDWVTGETPEISHNVVGQDMGGVSYNTIQKAITELIGAGVIAHEKKGVVWANGAGRANRYKFALPVTPPQKTGRAHPKKRVEPTPKNGQHFTNSYIQKKGASAHKDAPRRGGGDKASSGNGAPNNRLTELMAGGMDYTTARRTVDAEAQ